MRSGTGNIVRLIVCICGLPLMVVSLVFMACYTPIYGLISLLSPSKTKREAKPQTIVTNKMERPSLSALRIKHA